MNSSNNINGLPDLLTRMAAGDFQNLRVFLSSSKHDNRGLPMDFLYVDSQSFGMVRVKAVDYCKETVTISITECSSGVDQTLCLDINQQPAFVMVNWQDILDMVWESDNKCTCSDDLLEFDY